MEVLVPCAGWISKRFFIFWMDDHGLVMDDLNFADDWKKEDDKQFREEAGLTIAPQVC